MNKKVNRYGLILALVVISNITVPANAESFGSIFTTIFDNKLKKADRYYENYQYQEALDLYLAVLEEDKENVEVKLKTAECYRILDQLDKASPLYKEVLASGYDDYPIYKYYYAQSLVSIGDYEGAQEWVLKYADETSDYQRVEELQSHLLEIEQLYEDSNSFIVRKLDINSSRSDFAPSFFQDGLVFVSSRDTKLKKKHTWDKTPYLDLYYSEFQTDGSLGTARRFNKKINSRFHEGPVAFYDDGKKIVFTRSKITDGSLISDNGRTIEYNRLYTAEIDEDGRWNNIESFKYNNKEHSIGHPTISADGYIMYFTSDQPDGFGGTDIYKSVWNGAEWTTPQNLGPEVNTKGNEMFPFVDNRGMLYFASNGKGGLGGLDIFQIDLTQTSQKAINLGYPINSMKDDFGLVLWPDGNSGYFSSNREEDTDDIFYFQTNPEGGEAIASRDYQQMDFNAPDAQLTASNEPLSYVENLEDYNFNSGGYEEPDSDGQSQSWEEEYQENRTETSTEDYVDNYEIESFDSYTSESYNQQTEYIDPNQSEFENRVVDNIKSSEKGTVTVSSQVIHKLTYDPLSNATIDVIVNGSLQERIFTDQQGFVNFQVDPNYDYQLVASKPGYESNDLQISGSSIDPAGEESIVITLESAISAIAVEATVVDNSTKEILPGAQVDVYVDNSDKKVEYQVNQGIMSLAAEPGTNYVIVASNPGYNDIFINLSTDSLSTVENNTFTMPLSTYLSESSNSSEARKKFTLLGIVTDSQTGELISGAEVKLFINGVEREIMSSEEYGEVEFKTQQDQTYMLLATHSNYQDLIYHLPNGYIEGKEHGFELAMIPHPEMVAEDHILEELQELNSTADPDLMAGGTADMIVVEDMQGTDQLFLTMGESIYQVENEGYNTYLKGNNQRILLGNNYQWEDLTDRTTLNQILAQHGYEIGDIIRVNNIYYDFDRSNIRWDAEGELQKLAELLEKHQEMSLVLGSHTDVRGSDTYNQALSERRAQSAIEYLVDLGVDRERLTAQSYGESSPVNGCVNDVHCTENQHQLNRRTDFKLILDNSLSQELLSSAN